MAVSNTGSRNGIITWAVAATVLGLGSLIWAVISFTQASKAVKDMDALSVKYKTVIDQAGLAGDAVTQLTAAREDPTRGFPNTMPLLEVSRRQTEALTTLVGGAGATTDKAAIAAVQGSLASAKTVAGKDVTIDDSSLVGAIDSMSGAIKTLKATNTQLANDLKASQDAATAAETDKGIVVTASDQKVADAVKAQTEAVAGATAYGASRDAQLIAVQGDAAKQVETGIKGTDELNGQINQIRQQNAQLKHELDDRNAQLGKFRVPTDQIIQQADGVITKTAGTDRVFINLGRGDQIAAGMTFEVFDKLGVPRVRADEPADDKLLKGIASIEVVKVDPGISECRVVRLSPGVAITEGDPIVNVVYDKNVKFNFLVFGKFNLDNKGDASERDADIVRRLISGWGANVATEINAKTDFVVLGEEPVVPNFTQDQLAREPEKAFAKEQAETALEQYTDIRGKAQQLNIPILTQNKFLYMIGYYEEGKR